MNKTYLILASSLAISFTAEVHARPEYVNRVPNGTVNSCATCHTAPPALNAFGDDFLAAGIAWTQALAAMDSDADGFTNGQELGDPKGTGTPLPGAAASEPGNSSSTPTLTPPTIGISSPTNGATEPDPFQGTITIDTPHMELLTSVEFYANDSLLGTATNAPFSLAVNLTAGSYNLSARATDYLGATNTSAAVSIQVGTSTQPTQPSLAGSLNAAKDSFILQITGQAGITYHVQASESLSSATNWTEVGTATGDQPTVWFTNSIAPAVTNRFYRVLIP
jgi:hypothetical protein